LDFSRLQRPHVRMGKTRMSGKKSLELRFQYIKEDRVPWPSSAQGFLYFRRPSSPNAHPAAGSLRFRSVKSPDDVQHAFGNGFSANGAALNCPHAFEVTVDAGGYKVPWAIPLVSLRRVPQYAPIWEQLQLDALITPHLSNEINRIMKHGPQAIRAFKCGSVLEDIHPPWILELDTYSSSIIVLAADGIRATTLFNATTPPPARPCLNLNGKQGMWMDFNVKLAQLKILARGGSSSVRTWSTGPSCYSGLEVYRSSRSCPRLCWSRSTGRRAACTSSQEFKWCLACTNTMVGGSPPTAIASLYCCPSEGIHLITTTIYDASAPRSSSIRRETRAYIPTLCLV
jgi:hypothetical protein